MKNDDLKWTARVIAVLALAGSIGALAEDVAHKKFTGVFNAYTPQVVTTTGATTTTTGPYEVRGPWTLVLKAHSTKADFYAAVDMEFSDGWVLTAGKGNFDPNARGAHTHHITLADGDVTRTSNGFQVTGTAIFTLNGGQAPVTVSPSPVVIEVTGSGEVKYSNITLTFQDPGSKHFGNAPLPGVIRKVESLR